ncbi:PIN domain-containing protein [Candidatus Roizmanbacteria bacterium]|nr:PIN domain-containing protein [Candidatus Roizmanbacteria bacterium]
MVKVLIDTDIIIDFLRTKKGLLLDLYRLQSEEKLELYISSITALELFSGISSKKLKLTLLELISTLKVVGITLDLAVFAGELKRDLQSSIPFADLLIGASALYIRAQLATHNQKHFKGIPKLKFVKS